MWLLVHRSLFNSMSIPIKGYYHCNQCDSLFESMLTGVDSQSCPNCGESVVGILESGSSLADGHAKLGYEDSTTAQDRYESSLQEGGAEQGDKKTDSGGYQLADDHKVARQMRAAFIAWILFVAFVVSMVIHFNGIEDEQSTQPSMATVSESRPGSERKVRNFALPKCSNAIRGFLNASTASAKAQYVYNGVRLAREMEAFYSSRPNFYQKQADVRIVQYNDLRITGVEAIGAICQSDVGERFEVVFIRDGQDWKIEWKSFVRYSETDWLLFSSMENGTEADFRLYMRIMDVGEDLAGDDIMVKFYKPDVFRGREFEGYGSDSVRVSAFGFQGQLISGVKAMNYNQREDPVGMKIADFDPENYHRVRVRMRLRKGDGQKPYLEVVRILANHWYDPVIVKETGLADDSE